MRRSQAMATADPETATVTEPGEVQVRRALLTVSDKRGLIDFARGLADLGIEIVSTGGTARELEGARIGGPPIDRYTGFSEIPHGRGQTQKPRDYAGRRAACSHPARLAKP